MKAKGKEGEGKEKREGDGRVWPLQLCHIIILVWRGHEKAQEGEEKRSKQGRACNEDKDTVITRRDRCKEGKRKET
jgi:hypothetical protein